MATDLPLIVFNTCKREAAHPEATGDLSWILSALGVFGVVAYAVRTRRGELGIRVALGASPGSQLSMVPGNGPVWTSWSP